MKPAPFAYSAPETLEEVLALLAEHGDEAKIIAGGQSLMPMLAMRLARPARLVDIQQVAELRGIDHQDGVVRIGATTTEREAERSDVVTAQLPVLAEALPHIGHVSIRNRGTVGGSLAHADASAELPAVAVVTEAEMVVRSRSGERAIPAAEFFEGHFTTALADEECLVAVRLPATRPGAGWGFEEIARRHGDFALVGVAAMVETDGAAIGSARICLMGVADRAIRVPEVERQLVGAPVSRDTFEAAASAAVAGLEPASDMHGSGAYRRHLAGVAVRRALTRAARGREEARHE